ncbi:MAG TPA: HAMP domain-containing sensor histidine kinase [Anaeromyxobacteraceae bacterium]|nr:HAMP domain-containing sensor histidine kinase [Anaeromyxobacteraceae bacterium]
MSQPAPSGPRGRLFWRIYLHGLLLLVVVALVLGAIGAVMRHTWPAEAPGRVARWTAARLAEVRDDPARLGAELQRARDAFGIGGTVWSEGTVLATSVDPPLPPPGEARFGRGRGRDPDRPRDRDRPFRIFHAGPPRIGVVPLGGSPPAFLVFSGGPPPFSFLRLGLLGGAVLVALALASIPLARGIANPVERLTSAVRAFGRGDLSVRARVTAPGEVGELSRAFDEMADRLERQVRAEKELLANVSHELRTPLARIRIALELAAEGDLAKARHHLAGMGLDVAEVERLVDDVLTASRLELGAAAGTEPLQRATVSPRDLVDVAAERFRAAHPDRELRVEVEGEPPALDADPMLLRRALDNLLENAAKYSDAPAPVTLSARFRGGIVALEVRDRGIGIDAADVPRLFTPFFRTDRSRGRGSGGTGLGLALAKRIAEAHGGNIAVESRAGEGTLVRIELPLRARA